MFSCQSCQKSFKESHNLKNHIKFEHKMAPNGILSCEYCDFKANEVGLNIHSKICLENPMILNVCQKSINENLERSRQLHPPILSPNLPQKCSYCGFKSKKADMKTHTEICQKNHQRSKQLDPPILKPNFPQSKKEKIEIDYSRMEKLGSNKSNQMFPCHSCDKSYTELHSLKNHIKIVHEGAKIYSCNLCDESYTDYKDLNRHYKRAHENQENEVNR